MTEIRFADNVGEMIPPERELNCRTEIGNATVDDQGYEIAFVGGAPYVRSMKTHKQFILHWTDILDLARHAGIDE